MPEIQTKQPTYAKTYRYTHHSKIQHRTKMIHHAGSGFGSRLQGVLRASHPSSTSNKNDTIRKQAASVQKGAQQTPGQGQGN